MKYFSTVLTISACLYSNQAYCAENAHARPLVTEPDAKRSKIDNPSHQPHVTDLSPNWAVLRTPAQAQQRYLELVDQYNTLYDQRTALQDAAHRLTPEIDKLFLRIKVLLVNHS